MNKVYLVGAGPGDIELLTVKALKLVQTADVIVYDKLVNEDILAEKNEDCELIYVGKEQGHHILPQEEINELLYNLSLKYKKVVRLKGGDPFVFGRGGEEALYLKKRDRKFEIVPGISSSISVLSYAGIPITHRDISHSFRVITGHTRLDECIVNENMLQCNETTVFLMSLNNLEKIVNKFISFGKDLKTPCAIISKGTTEEQKVITGTLGNIVSKSSDAVTPSIIVFGEVVKLREQLKWFD